MRDNARFAYRMAPLPSSLRPLAEWPLHARRGVRGVFTDIDDTLTSHGAITPDALRALHALRAAGLVVIPITGRPIGWCTSFLSGSADAPWPVAAMVAENGGVAYVPAATSQNMDEKGQSRLSAKGLLLSKIYQDSAPARSQHAHAMRAVAHTVQQALPGVRLARDSAGRETDLAFDYAEYDRHSPHTVQQVLQLLQAAGMQTTVSSIHIHGSFAGHDKWTGAQWIVRTLWGRELAAELEHWVFVGDSGNDQAMFQHFPHSVGVANIRAVAPQLQHLPRYVTESERGTGFAELAQALLDAR